LDIQATFSTIFFPHLTYLEAQSLIYVQ